MRLLQLSLFLALISFFLSTTGSPIDISDTDDVANKWNSPTPTDPCSSSSNDNEKRGLLPRGGDDCEPSATATYTAAWHHDPGSMEAIYGDSSVTPQMGVAGAIFIVLGISLMVFGFRSFRPTLAVCGFITFGVITWVGMANSQPPHGYINDPVTMIAVSTGLGVLGAILYSFFWNIAIYLVGGMGGLAFGLFVLCWREDLVITQNVARACFLVAISFFLACVTFFLERYVILFATSFTGSYIFFLGIDFLTHTGYLAGVKKILDNNPHHRVIYSLNSRAYALLAMTIVLFLISFAWQYLYNRNRDFGVNFVAVKSAPAPEEGGGGGSDGGEAEGGSEKKE